MRRKKTSTTSYVKLQIARDPHGVAKSYRFLAPIDLIRQVEAQQGRTLEQGEPFRATLNETKDVLSLSLVV